MATDLRRPPAVLDSRSFDGFYRRHLGEIYRFVLQDVGNRADAEEVTQTAFLDAFRALRRGHEPEMPRAWMYGIARNAARRRFRTQSRRPREVELDPAVVEGLADAEESPWTGAVRSAFASLRPSHRDVLFLREVEGLSYAEIAERMELSQSAVETLLFRARRSLRERLEAEGLRPTARPSRRTRLKGLALLPAAFLGRLSDRMQQLVSPELATKAAGAVTAVAIGAGVAVGTHEVLRVDAATGSENDAATLLAHRDASIFTPPFLRRETTAASPKAASPARRDKADPKPDRDKGRSAGSDQPGGSAGTGGTSESATVSGGLSVGGTGVDAGGSLTTPPITVPEVEAPALPAAPIETPTVETPPVEVPGVEADLPVDPPLDTDELLGG